MSSSLTYESSKQAENYACLEPPFRVVGNCGADLAQRDHRELKQLLQKSGAFSSEKQAIIIADKAESRMPLA